MTRKAWQRLLVSCLALALALATAPATVQWLAAADQQPPLIERVLDYFPANTTKNGPQNHQTPANWQLVSDPTRADPIPARLQVGRFNGRNALYLQANLTENTPTPTILARRLLKPAKQSGYPADAYQGLLLVFRAETDRLAIQLRTADCKQLDQCYQTEITPDNKWQRVLLPFHQFKPHRLRAPLDLARLETIALAPLGPPGPINIYLDRLSFYQEPAMNKQLTPEEARVILDKGTEAPFSGQYYRHFEKGAYTCKQCGSVLFNSSSKFHSECGWPSFDDQVPDAVIMKPDSDGRRTEIICANCKGHLGHIFTGEQLTPKNQRYCVNSLSLDFTPQDQLQTERALFASGCFWGTEYYLQRAPGVLATTVGYTGGQTENPTYAQVCTDKTGHAETVEVLYNATQTSFEALARLFFETHDFTQFNRQGPDVGTQYRSAIFYLNPEQERIAEQLVRELRQKGFKVKTKLTPASTFWPAEDYHQDYYNHNGKTPYCHAYRKIFD